MLSLFGRRVRIGVVALLFGSAVYGVAQMRGRIWAR
jgi:hypothetical protein